MDNQIDKNYSVDMEKRIQFSAWIDKIASMEPEERTKYLQSRGIDESLFTGQFEEERKAVEGGEQSQPTPFMDAIAMATPLLTIASGVGGGLVKSLVAVLGGGPVTQEVADFIGSLVGAMTPSGLAKITEKYGAEKGAKIIELLTKEMEQGGEAKVNTLYKMIKEGTKELKPKLAGQLVEHLPENMQEKIGKLFLDYDDSKIRSLKGFISESLKGDFELAQKTHLDNLGGLLNIFKKAEPAEQEILHNMIVDEFDKYLQVMTKKVQTINKNGKTVYQLVKQEFSQNDIDILGKQFTKSEMLDALDRLVNRKNQRGAIDPQMFTFVKSLLSDSARNIYKAEVNAKLLSPHVLGVKLLSDAIQSVSQNIFQSAGIAMKHGLNAGQRNLIAVFSAYREMWPEAVRIAKLSFKTGEPEFQHYLEKISGKPVEDAISYLEGIDSTEPGMVANWLGHWYASGPRAVMSADQFAKVLNYRMELHTQAFYEALNRVEAEGIKGAEKLKIAEKLAKSFMDNLHENEWLFNKAKQGTFVRTFTDTTGLSRALTQLPDWVRVYFPFIRTKLNLFKEGVKYIPGLGSYDVFMGEGLERSTTLAKQFVGTAFSYYIWNKVMDGTITGKGPKIKPKGYNVYSVHIGDYAYGYSHLGQIAEPIKFVADAAQAYANAKPQDKGKLANAIIKSSQIMLKDSSVVPELVKFVHALETQDTSRAVAFFASQPLTGIIPTPFEEATKIIDPEHRKVRSTIDEVWETIPGLSSRLPPYLDEDGKSQYLPPGVSADDTPPSRWAVALDMLSPITVKHDNMDDVSKAELKYGLGNHRIPDHIDYNGQILNLSPQQQEDWGKATGHELKIRGMNQRQYKQSVLDDPKYIYIPEQDKDEFIKEELQNVHRMFYEAGKTQTLTKLILPTSVGPVDITYPTVTPEQPGNIKSEESSPNTKVEVGQ